MNDSDQQAIEVKRLRTALTSILGWRERDRNNLGEVLVWIEDLARYALDEQSETK